MGIMEMGLFIAAGFGMSMVALFVLARLWP